MSQQPNSYVPCALTILESRKQTLELIITNITKAIACGEKMLTPEAEKPSEDEQNAFARMCSTYSKQIIDLQIQRSQNES